MERFALERVVGCVDAAVGGRRGGGRSVEMVAMAARNTASIVGIAAVRSSSTCASY